MMIRLSGTIPFVLAGCLNAVAPGQCVTQTLSGIDEFGSGVAIDGDVAVVGDPEADNDLGRVRVYRLIEGVWTLEDSFGPPSFSPLQVSFGGVVDVSGDVIASTDPFLGPTATEGAVHIHRFNGRSWEFETTIPAPENAYFFGSTTIDVEGDVLLAGAYGYTFDLFNLVGAAYIFRFQGGKWVQEAFLHNNFEGGDFGRTFSLSSNAAIVGAPTYFSAGRSYVFRLSGESTWMLEQVLTAPDPDEYAFFGYSISLQDDVALIGAPKLFPFGHVFEARYNGAEWDLRALPTPSDIINDDAWLGGDVALSDDGQAALVGAPLENHFFINDGAAFLYHHDGTAWVYQQKFTAGGGGFGDPLALSADGDTAFIGTLDANYVRVYDGLAADSPDCNTNREPDACDIFSGTSLDKNGDGVPDECLPGNPFDLDGDSIVDGADLGLLLLAWGKCPKDVFCQPDFNLDGMVDGEDLGELLLNWTR
jgi:hypothetical protein